MSSIYYKNQKYTGPTLDLGSGSLTTDNKTIVGAINELDAEVDTIKGYVGSKLKYAAANIDLSTRSWTQSGQGMYYCTGYSFDYATQIVSVSLINWSARKPILIIPYIYTPNPKVINLMTTDITNATSGQLGIGILYY